MAAHSFSVPTQLTLQTTAFSMRRSPRLLTRTFVTFTGRITLVTRGTAVLVVPTRDGIWCETTSLSCYGIHFLAARAVIWTHCHYMARLALAGNRIFSLWPLKKKTRNSGEKIRVRYLLKKASPVAIMSRTLALNKPLSSCRWLFFETSLDAQSFSMKMKIKLIPIWKVLHQNSF